MYWKLDDEGRPVKLTGPNAAKEAAVLFDDPKRIVKQEYVEHRGDRYWVSTVFLPMGALDRTRVFETMVFPVEGTGGSEAYGPEVMVRYTGRSWAAAQIKHDLVVTLVRIQGPTP